MDLKCTFSLLLIYIDIHILYIIVGNYPTNKMEEIKNEKNNNV
jgi:hypothetical protein